MSIPAFVLCHSSLFCNNSCNTEMNYNVEHFVMDFILPHLRWFLESWIFRIKIDRRRERSVTRVVVDIAVWYSSFDPPPPLSRCLCFSLTHTHTHTHSLSLACQCVSGWLTALFGCSGTLGSQFVHAFVRVCSWGTRQTGRSHRSD